MTGLLKKSLIIVVLPILFTVGCEAKNKGDDIVINKIKAGALVVDVRSNEEVAEGMYKGAVHIPIDQVESRLAEFGAKDKPVVLYCRSGNRAGRVKQYLESKGFTDVTNAGGLRDMPAIN